MAKKSKFEIAVIDKIREVRKEKGISQRDIAAFLGKTEGFIGQIESTNSDSKYNLNHINRLAYEMNCSPKDLMPDDAFWEDLPDKKK
ncbi:helix-turn-helix domain-containing protein [Echinicola salinicaeni]|uniref:helix-turn-helix domain-containing protein n=1 Tax=Echinicola salinicaeni TaxID=2762757 RepID=UPI00164619F4|nr:helix-turn-helix transcriptional regulator [Echinicola salinicaeni]